MTENSGRISKNNRGFSLVELIIVIAIIAALIGTVILSVSMVFSANAKACSNDLQRAVADCKVTTMGKAKAWLVVYRGDNGRIYSQMHIMEQKEGGAVGELEEITEEAQKIGGNRVSVLTGSMVERMISNFRPEQTTVSGLNSTALPDPSKTELPTV